MTATTDGPVTAELEARAEKAESRRGLFLALPSYIYLLFLFALPLVIIGVYSFASRSRTGMPKLEAWNLDSIAKLFTDDLVRSIFARSLIVAVLTTTFCLLAGYPFAYYIATRSEKARNLLLVFVMIPFWTNFLVRTYAWRVLLGEDGLITELGRFLKLWDSMLFTLPAVYIGLIYGFLPFMVLPLYAAIERLDSFPSTPRHRTHL